MAAKATSTTGAEGDCVAPQMAPMMASRSAARPASVKLACTNGSALSIARVAASWMDAGVPAAMQPHTAVSARSTSSCMSGDSSYASSSSSR